MKETSGVTDITPFTVETGEKVLAIGQHTAWWQWTPAESGWATFDTLNDDSITGTRLYNTHLAVFTGSAVDALSLVASNDNAFNTLKSSVTFYATGGVTYHIQLDGSAAGNFGQAVLSMRFFRPQKLRILSSSIASQATQFDLTTSISSAVTGKLMLDGKIRTVKGSATMNGLFVGIIPQPSLPNGTPVEPFVLTVDLVPNTNDTHNASLEGSGMDLISLTGYHAMSFTTAAPHPIAPYHTASLKPSILGLGYGYLTAKVAASGAVAMTGRTGDGKPFTTSSVLCEGLSNKYPAPFGMGSPQLTGGVAFVDIQGGSDTLIGLSTCNYQRKPATTGSFYTAGFSTPLTIKGGAYAAPLFTNQRPLGFLDGTNGAGKLGLDTSVGEYAGFTESLTLSPTNVFSFQSPARKPLLKINPKTGLVTGSIIEPVGKPRALYGILSNDGGTPRIFGYISGATKTGRMSVLP